MTIALIGLITSLALPMEFADLARRPEITFRQFFRSALLNHRIKHLRSPLVLLPLDHSSTFSLPWRARVVRCSTLGG